MVLLRATAIYENDTGFQLNRGKSHLCPLHSNVRWVAKGHDQIKKRYGYEVTNR